ncbi:sugar phosphate isomerase/epimerase [Pedobacter sp. MC2016-24]|uniref:sugar phosphate isomerase/epimerase family protein n=1 Tax=Pedobacter sp. MC2016-24 TaxID=2780090 RepID=UPI0018816E0A|nr:sugar phosphate isomerase/epimerase [Pedobacter sp. MC2016-24]MBE9598437.1 sugar phosphate isomerase/epimerase [Pedobacter sp. MC2016-24]
MSVVPKFLCPRWGFEALPWPVFLKQVKEAGYAGIEWFPFGENTDVQEVLRLLEIHDLDFAIVMAVIKPYTGFERYLQDLEQDLDQLMAIRTATKAPLFFSAQTGREFFDAAQIQACLTLCNAAEAKYQTPVHQETHRNKWSFAAHQVAPVLTANPDLKLTLDVSHWFCVSESYLEDQQAAVNSAIQHARHIHARVGSTQSSQVWDPANAEYAEALAAHVQIWDKWVQHMNSNNRQITITPEFGPSPYLVKGNRTTDLRAEQWRINLWMKDFLQKRYS